MPDRTPPARWEQSLPALPTSVAKVRRGVVGFARQMGAEEAALGDVALAVSEAATNAVVHAFVDDAEPGTLHVATEPRQDALVVWVRDDGRGMQPRSDSPGLGLGLPLIGNVAASIDIREGPGGRGTEIRMVFTTPGLRGADAAADAGSERYALLAEVARVTEDLGWPAQGIDRIIAVLVPAVADACAIDLAGADGTLRRVAARGAEGPPAGRPGAPATVVEVGPAATEGLRWWVTVPLLGGEEPLGALGLGLGEERGRPDDGTVAFFGAIAEHAVGGLANTQLVAELRRTRRRLERILDALAEAVTVQDATGALVYANQAAVRLLGAASLDELLTAGPGELAGRFVITGEDGGPVSEFPGDRLLAGRPATPLLTRSVHRASGVARWLLTKSTRLDDEGVLAVNIIEDVTEAKEAELRQRFLAEAGEVLASSLDPEETLRRVATLVVPVLADWCAVDVLSERGGIERVGLAHVDPEKLALGREAHERYPPALEAERGLGAVLRGGPAELYADVPDELLAQSAQDAEHLRLLREIGLRSVMLVPMRVGDRTAGAITLVMAESRRTFGPADLAFAEDLARRAALAVETARRFSTRSGA